MHDMPVSALGLVPWLELTVVLAVGIAIVVGVAWVACKCLRSSTAQRALWRMATLGLLLLLLFELTGIGAVWVELVRAPLTASASGSCGAISGAVALDLAADCARGCETADRVCLQSGVAVGDDDGTNDTRGAGQSVSATDHQGSRAGPHNASATGTEGSVLSPMPGEWRVNEAGVRSDVSPGIGRDAFQLDLPVATSNLEHTVHLRPASSPLSAEALSAEALSSASPEAGSVPFWSAWPLILWVVVSVVLLGRIAWARMQLRRFSRQAAMIDDPHLNERVRQLARQLAYERRVRLLEGPALSAPAAFGGMHPTIVLPPSFAQRFDRAEQAAILAHELAHLAAGDSAWKCTSSVVSSLLWWHPLVYVVRRSLEATSEAAADEASLLVPNGPDILAGCLVVLGRTVGTSSRWGWLSVGGSPFRSQLGKRVQRLLELPACSWSPSRCRRWGLVCYVAPLVLVLTTILGTAWARPRAVISEGETTMTLLNNTWRRSLAAAAMALLAPLASTDHTAVAQEGAPQERVEPGDPRPRDEAEARQRERERREGFERRERAEREQVERRREREREERERRMSEEQRRRAPPEPRVEEILRESLELQNRAFDIEMKLHLMNDDERARAEDLKREREELSRRLQEIKERHPKPPAELARKFLERRLEMLTKGAGRLHEADRHKVAETMEREAREVAQELERIARAETPGRERERDQERERRMQHLNVAIDNLHAAGLHDLADKLAQEAEQMMREQGPGGPPHPDVPASVEHDLRGQVDQLRQEMNELRRMMQELLERQH